MLNGSSESTNAPATDTVAGALSRSAQEEAVPDRLIIGCGNLLRGDDALGPRVIRRLWERGFGDRVRLSDGGTAGMNVAFDMRGMREVVIIDACRTGAAPGTLFEIPGAEVETPPLEAVNLHNFRWDHALSFGKWLLKAEYPSSITVFLVEAVQFEPGAELSPAVEAAMETLVERLERRFPATSGTESEMTDVELTESGSLHIDGTFADRRLRAGLVLFDMRNGELVLRPIHHGAVGGFLLKQRNARGDRSVLVKERLIGAPRPGIYRARWDVPRGELRVPLERGPLAAAGIGIDATADTPRSPYGSSS